MHWKQPQPGRARGGVESSLTSIMPAHWSSKYPIFPPDAAKLAFMLCSSIQRGARSWSLEPEWEQKTQVVTNDAMEPQNQSIWTGPSLEQGGMWNHPECLPWLVWNLWVAVICHLEYGWNSCHPSQGLPLPELNQLHTQGTSNNRIYFIRKCIRVISDCKR